MKVRVITSRSYHALFMHNMLIRPSAEELANFGEPDFTIYNAGAFPANRHANYMTSNTSVDISLKTREMVILGTQYAGEMKKGVFRWAAGRSVGFKYTMDLRKAGNAGAALL